LKRLITAALPYVNNVPHLGNLVQSLSGDVFARYCRLQGHETLYICGTDEYGTATETRAREEGITPQELCDRYYGIHDNVYKWFDFSFDIFGRTSSPLHTDITQGIFLALHKNNYIVSHTSEQLYSEKSAMFLADRYVIGTCPKCSYAHARGDQCEQCGTLLDPTDLIDVRSAIDGSEPIKKKTRHLYLNLPKLLPLLEEWLSTTDAKERWDNNAMQMTRAWIRDGLQERAITRDLSWGIPVPLEEYEKKVFYVWFDACIGYISITAQLTERWREWWQSPDSARLYQFVGKDNIPFHTVIFPSSLLGTGERWTMLHHISSTEYLNYEGGQFSKSRRVGVFGTDAIESGIPADVWRFYLLYNRPESSDYTFTWDDFRARTNKELIGNFANFFNRLTTFLHRHYSGALPRIDTALQSKVAERIPHYRAEMKAMINAVEKKMERIEIRSALREVLRISDMGNKLFQEYEPWKKINEEPEETAHLLSFLVTIAKNLSILIAPFLPQTAKKCATLLGIADVMQWHDLSDTPPDINIRDPILLFQRLEAKEVAAFKKRFGGDANSAANSAAKHDVADDEAKEKSNGTMSAHERFRSQVRLIAARILSVDDHHNANHLFVEHIDDGITKERIIVSGLAGHYKKEELVGKTVVLVDNLKPIKLRGVMSNGMLLAAQSADGSELEVLEVDAPPGTLLTLQDDSVPSASDYPTIKAAQFFAIPIVVADYQVMIDGAPLTCNGAPLHTARISDGTVS